MMRISPIPAFDDNYIWLLQPPDGRTCAVVDPGDEDPVIERLSAEGLELGAILITHKHGDHVGGVRELKARWPNAKVFGPANERIPERDVALGEGDQVDLPGMDMGLRVLDVPGHTEGHIAYFAQIGGDGVLFCGDTLFAAGCGRVFSGTFEQLSESLQKIAELPSETLAYCAHEYTLANLGFAKWVEPDSADLLARERADQRQRDAGQPTVPSSLQLELATNPFMRTDQPTVIAAAERWAGKSLGDRNAVFRALREWKDRDYD